MTSSDWRQIRKFLTGRFAISDTYLLLTSESLCTDIQKTTDSIRSSYNNFISFRYFNEVPVQPGILEVSCPAVLSTEHSNPDVDAATLVAPSRQVLRAWLVEDTMAVTWAKHLPIHCDELFRRLCEISLSIPIDPSQIVARDLRYGSFQAARDLHDLGNSFKELRVMARCLITAIGEGQNDTRTGVVTAIHEKLETIRASILAISKSAVIRKTRADAIFTRIRDDDNDEPGGIALADNFRGDSDTFFWTSLDDAPIEQLLAEFDTPSPGNLLCEFSGSDTASLLPFLGLPSSSPREAKLLDVMDDCGLTVGPLRGNDIRVTLPPDAVRCLLYEGLNLVRAAADWNRRQSVTIAMVSPNTVLPKERAPSQFSCRVEKSKEGGVCVTITFTMMSGESHYSPHLAQMIVELRKLANTLHPDTKVDWIDSGIAEQSKRELGISLHLPRTHMGRSFPASLDAAAITGNAGPRFDVPGKLQFSHPIVEAGVVRGSYQVFAPTSFLRTEADASIFRRILKKLDRILLRFNEVSDEATLTAVFLPIAPNGADVQKGSLLANGHYSVMVVEGNPALNDVGYVEASGARMKRVEVSTIIGSPLSSDHLESPMSILVSCPGELINDDEFSDAVRCLPRGLTINRVIVANDGGFLAVTSGIAHAVRRIVAHAGKAVRFGHWSLDIVTAGKGSQIPSYLIQLERGDIPYSRLIIPAIPAEFVQNDPRISDLQADDVRRCVARILPVISELMDLFVTGPISDREIDDELLKIGVELRLTMVSAIADQMRVQVDSEFCEHWLTQAVAEFFDEHDCYVEEPESKFCVRRTSERS